MTGELDDLSDTRTLFDGSEPMDMALYATMQLAVVFALAIALILIVGHRLGA